MSYHAGICGLIFELVAMNNSNPCFLYTFISDEETVFIICSFSNYATISAFLYTFWILYPGNNTLYPLASPGSRHVIVNCMYARTFQNAEMPSKPLAIVDFNPLLYIQWVDFTEGVNINLPYSRMDIMNPFEPFCPIHLLSGPTQTSTILSRSFF